MAQGQVNLSVRIEAYALADTVIAAFRRLSFNHQPVPFPAITSKKSLFEAGMCYLAAIACIQLGDRALAGELMLYRELFDKLGIPMTEVEALLSEESGPEVRPEVPE